MSQTITIRIKPEDNALIRGYAKLHGLSIGEAMRRAMLEKIEDEYDLQQAQKALQEYNENPISYTHEEIMEEFGLS